VAWHRTRIAVADLAADPRAEEVAGHPLVVVAAVGHVFAVEDRCSHAGCAFSEDGEFDGERVICDCHGSEFDLRTGAVLRPPAERPIATYPTRTADGWVEVEVEG
jgi:nitrite reductase/ring-hydroxylating ferredoxin subunit